MGEKDLSQKNLEFFPDVFADCVNALHNQFQDISKYEVEGHAIKAQYTLENQTKTDQKMILRKMSYEGAIYRRQYQEKELYPAISILLYWGTPKWKSPCSLHKLMKDKLTDKNVKCVDNSRLRVYNMAHLKKKVRQRFQSDMKIIVNYLAEGRDYIPTDQKIRHMDAFLRMMKALTGDDRYEEILLQMAEEEKEGKISMCELLDRYWNGGVAEGRAEGLVEGKAASIGYIRNMYKHMQSTELIATLVSEKLEYINQIIALCSQYPAEDDVSIANRLLSQK